MMASKKKTKKKTLRQRLRDASQNELGMISAEAICAVEDVLRAHQTKISAQDVMRLNSGGDHKTLYNQLVTELANEAEDKLEDIYNSQIDLPIEESAGE